MIRLTITAQIIFEKHLLLWTIKTTSMFINFLCVYKVNWCQNNIQRLVMVFGIVKNPEGLITKFATILN